MVRLEEIKNGEHFVFKRLKYRKINTDDVLRGMTRALRLHNNKHYYFGGGLEVKPFVLLIKE